MLRVYSEALSACNGSSAIGGRESPTWTKQKSSWKANDELERHVWDTFVDGDLSVAFGRIGVVVSGSKACRERFGTHSQYLRHLADDVLLGIIEHAFSIRRS